MRPGVSAHITQRSETVQLLSLLVAPVGEMVALDLESARLGVVLLGLLTALFPVLIALAHLRQLGVVLAVLAPKVTPIGVRVGRVLLGLSRHDCHHRESDA